MNRKQSLFHRKPRLVLSILFAIFFVPLLLAWLMEAKQGSLSNKTTNHGQLLEPSLDFKALSLHDAKQQDIEPHIWRGHWLLVYALPLQCGASCEKTLFYLQQIRSSTGKDSGRVRNLAFGFNDLPADPHVKEILSKYPNTVALNTSYQKYSQLLAKIPNANLDQQRGNIFLIDPLGNIILAYSETTPPMDIYKDLTHLLKLSQIG